MRPADHAFLKHGPGGTGEDGPCDPGYKKCEIEREYHQGTRCCDRCELDIYWSPPWAHHWLCWHSSVNLGPSLRVHTEPLYPEHGSSPAPSIAESA